MCFFQYFILYSRYSNFIYELMFLMYLAFEVLFLFTFIMYWECHCFIDVGVNTSKRGYQLIACRAWEYIHT